MFSAFRNSQDSHFAVHDQQGSMYKKQHLAGASPHACKQYYWQKEKVELSQCFC